MSAQQSPTLAALGDQRDGPAPSPRPFVRLSRRLRDRRFWYVQGMVVAITAIHYGIELPGEQRPFQHLHHLLPALYVFPIIYASLHFRREGGLLTGAVCAVLVAPNIVLWHRSELEWAVELAQVGIAIVVAAVLSGRVEHEAAERQRAQEMAASMTLLGRRATRAQEEERRRLARELHDGVTQALSGLCRGLDLLEAQSREREGDGGTTVAELRAIAQRALLDMRRVTRDLRPTVLDDLGLVPALEWLASDVGERSRLQVALTCEDPPQGLSTEQELGVFRIVQEALSNIERHAEASRVDITVERIEHVVRVVVRDDGRGFEAADDPLTLVREGHYGLLGMQERAELHLGRLTVRSGTGGEGTSVVLEMPVTRPHGAE